MSRERGFCFMSIDEVNGSVSGPAFVENRGMMNCHLFEDSVPDDVCRLRKAELNGRGEFSCTGCRRDSEV